MMNKLVSLLLAIVLLLVATTAASAEKPPGVAPAAFVVPGGCIYGYPENGQWVPIKFFFALIWRAKQIR
jgi:ABC-type sugar transport system substrate-binding protein